MQVILAQPNYGVAHLANADKTETWCGIKIFFKNSWVFREVKLAEVDTGHSVFCKRCKKTIGESK